MGTLCNDRRSGTGGKSKPKKVQLKKKATFLLLSLSNQNSPFFGSNIDSAAENAAAAETAAGSKSRM